MGSDTLGAKSIADLVAGFRASLPELRDAPTSEAVVRQEYIDPFWTALGWDVANDSHRSYAVKDVLVEATVGTVEDQRVRRRRPDYLFRIDGFPRFVVEAKRPGGDLTADKESIFQAKTYAWSAQIPFAVLTSFEEFRLYDTTIKPCLDEPGRGLIEEFDLRFDDFATQWDVLRQTFGREAVADGSLERLLAKIKRVRAGRRIRGCDRMLFDLRGTEPVDQVFLKHLEDYRLRFAKAIHQENEAQFHEAETHHGAAKLAEATQRLIDRLVFIRVCEDRGIIGYRDILSEKVGKLDSDDDGKRNLMELAEFVCTFAKPSTLAEMEVLYPELVSEYYDASRAVDMYRRFAAEARAVFENYKHIRKLLR